MNLPIDVAKRLPSRAMTLKMAKFLLAGLPAFLIAIPLNIYLVEKAGWHMAAAYGVVLIVQVTINFFACVLFVFKRDASKPLGGQFFVFMAGILTARLLDWLIYGLLTGPLKIPYIVAQLLNVTIFSLAKFAFSRRTIEGK